jgi:hypothetical protein
MTRTATSGRDFRDAQTSQRCDLWGRGRSLMVRSAEVHRRVRSATPCTPSTGWRVAARILVAQDAPSQAPGRLPSSRLTAQAAVVPGSPVGGRGPGG